MIRRVLLAGAILPLAGCLGDRAQEPARVHAEIPSRETAVSVRVQAAHDEDTFFLRVRFPAEPGDRHESWRVVDGAFRREGGGFRDRQAAVDGDPERGDTSRVSVSSEVGIAVLLDDPRSAGRLLNFRETGCFGQCHDRQRQMPNWRASDGDEPMRVWTGTGMADLWIWGAHRTAAAGVADDLSFTSAGYVPDAGAAPWSAVDLGITLPGLVFDPADAGDFALSWDQFLAEGPYAFDDGTLDAIPDAVTLGSALALGWIPAEGDTVPAQVLSSPSGSRADVGASAVREGDSWDLVLSRALSTGDATGDLALETGHVYGMALALHRDGADGRDHYVSLPFDLLVGTSGEGVVAVALDGTAAMPSFSDESAFPVTELTMFLPGVTSFDWLVGSPVRRDGELREVDVAHGGAYEVASAQHGCADCHTVRSSDPTPPHMDAGPLERLVVRRGGVFGPTPFFEEED